MKIRANAATLLLAVLLASCTTKNDASVELVAVCAPPDDATKCSFSGTCDAVALGRPWVATRKYLGTVSESINSLQLPIQVNNRLKSNANPGTYRVNTNDFTVEEFRMSFSSTPGLSLPARTYPVNYLVPADGSTVVFVKAIPEETMTTIDAANLPALYTSYSAATAYVNVSLQAYGHTRDGQSIVTEPWTVSVDVRDVDTLGHSFDPVCADTTAVVVGICPNAAQWPGNFTCK